VVTCSVTLGGAVIGTDMYCTPDSALLLPTGRHMHLCACSSGDVTQAQLALCASHARVVLQCTGRTFVAVATHVCYLWLLWNDQAFLDFWCRL
jgi:hypothetical protein